MSVRNVSSTRTCSVRTPAAAPLYSGGNSSTDTTCVTPSSASSASSDATVQFVRYSRGRMSDGPRLAVACAAARPASALRRVDSGRVGDTAKDGGICVVAALRLAWILWRKLSRNARKNSDGCGRGQEQRTF